MILNSKKKGCSAGFTLIELLIVIGIIAMLSLLAVNGYAEYRKSTLLDLAADSIVSQIGEMRSNTIHGDVGSARFDAIKAELEGADSDAATVPDGTALCYGIYFDSGKIKTFSDTFSGKKRWNGTAWGYEGCEVFAKDLNDPEIELDDIVTILNVKINSSDASSGYLRFVPPNGEIEASQNSFDLIEGQLLRIEMQYGGVDDPKYQRTIDYDLTNFTANVEETT